MKSIKDLFGTPEPLAILVRIAVALERIAEAAEAKTLSGVGLRSRYTGDDPAAADFFTQTDEQFAEMEALEKAHPEIPFDADLDNLHER